MKKRKLITFTLGLLLLGSFYGCGSKENENETANTTTTSNSNPAYNPSTTTGSCVTNVNSLGSLREAVNNFRFRGEFSPIDTYHMVEGTFSIVQKEGWFDIKYNKQEFNQTRTFTRKGFSTSSNANHEYGNNKTLIRDRLMSILTASNMVYGQRSATYHEVLNGNNGDIIGIDLCMPIAANPVFYFQQSTNKSQFLQGVEATNF
jgi:hypothetical protein